VAITMLEAREHRLLRNVEQALRQKIPIATIPTVADLRARKLELTTSAVREALVGGELERFRVVVEALSAEFDIVDVALAAVKLVHAAEGGDRDEEEIPAPAPPVGKKKTGPPSKPMKVKGKGGTARLFVGAGREQGIRPADLVGAIANETGLPAKAIGAIEITDRFALVELPEDALDEVVTRLQGKPIKGKKVPIRRDRARGPR
jgi:ATP-dependent RNA helicase DeaD